MEEIMKKIELEVYILFQENQVNQYTNPNWIFPNHIEPMIDIAKNLCEKYGGNKQVCVLACLLHDTGLVYKRTEKSPQGHEGRSEEYAKQILTKHKLDQDTINQILNCIKVSDGKTKPQTVNEKIVASADIMSQYNSMHFYAKAKFYQDWDMYLEFLEKKLTRGFDKIHFVEEREQLKPIRDHIQKQLEQYRKYNYKPTSFN